MKRFSLLGRALTFSRSAASVGLAGIVASLCAAGAACTTLDFDVINENSNENNDNGCCNGCCNGCNEGGAPSTSSGEPTTSTATTTTAATTGAGGAGGDGGEGGTGGAGGGPCLTKGEGCGGKPKFQAQEYAGFGQVAVATCYGSTDSEYVLGVTDISVVPPPNSSYAAPMYHHPAWVRTKLGHIFGLTLDSAGNIYTTVTNIYNENVPLTNYVNPGVVWRLDSSTGQPSVFATLPNKGPALGNINYSCTYKSFYVSNFEDGRIYHLDTGGLTLNTFDHATGIIAAGGAPEPGDVSGVYAALGERPWAVQVFQDRLYYSLWNEDQGRPLPGGANEIWSIALDASGSFIGAPQLEISVPPMGGQNWSMPVSDISFGPKGTMMLVERGMNGDGSTTAHVSRALEYEFCKGAWGPTGKLFEIGELNGPDGNNDNSAGGVDYDFSPGGYVWFTGDALDFNTPDVVYGFQGTPPAGGDITVSTLIDANNQIVVQDKNEIGDIEVPLP